MQPDAIDKTKEPAKNGEGKEPLLIHLSLLLGTSVVDVAGRSMGRIREVAITPGVQPTVSELIWGGKNDLKAVAPASFEHAPNGKLRLRGDAQPRPFNLSDPLLLLDRDLLDQQIIDVYGRKVVRVNDIALFWFPPEAGGEMRPVEVEVGTRGAMRRLLKGLAPRQVVKSIAAQLPSKVIPWDFVDLIEADPARRVRLKISHERLEKFHPSDLADILEDLAPVQREAIFNMLDEEVAAEALEEVEPKLQKQLLESLNSERAADIMEEMDPSAAADLLGELRKERSEAILEEMEPEERQEVKDLLEFSEHSAAGRMTTNYIAVPADTTVAQAIDSLRNFDDDPETVTAIYLVDADGVLQGVVPLARLLLALPETKVAALSESRFVSCPATMHDKQVAELFDRYNLYSLPVVDEHNNLVGVVNADHVIAFMRQQA
ncbi:MAG TPA: CBS domain-containing protein [Acidobacteriaceae bacterium]|nr:CBS domain-containing protein [Acidobacteriaceae bacterium]